MERMLGRGGWTYGTTVWMGHRVYHMVEHALEHAIEHVVDNHVLTIFIHTLIET